MSPLGSIGYRVVSMALAIGVASTISIVAVPQTAYAADYPTWAEVSEAQHDVRVAKKAIKKIEKILGDLKAAAKKTAKEAEEKGNIWQEADIAYQAATSKAATLQEQADAASAAAAQSEQRAGQMAAQLTRASGQDTTATLLINSGDADDLLNTLGMSRKVSEQSYAIYEVALTDRNTAQALTDQADVAKAELAVLKAAAEKAFNVAKKASEKAAAALEEQLDHQAELEQQLIVLKERRAATEADYIKGVREKFDADPSLDAGMISDTGWAKPAGGYITSTFGWRILYGASNFHKGTDLGAACNAKIYAAHSGTVSYAAYGWNGGYGNFVIIDNGNGVSTAYGHIVDGGIKVSAGESVGVGKTIARVGTTGNSTGCHLHYEVRINGTVVDPVPYMKDQGIKLG